MTMTEPTQARVLRGVSIGSDGTSPFLPVSELPRLEVVRPEPTGDDPLDATRAAAWEEGLAEGREEGFAAGRAEGFDVGREEGRAAGYLEGREAAVADARREVAREVEAGLQALARAADQLLHAEAVSLADIESQVVTLALDIAEAVLQREIAVAADPGADALRRALALAPDHGDVVARLNPTDVESLTDLASIAPGRSIEVVADPAVGRGGALVEAGAARLDARLDTAIDRVREVLER